MYFVTEVKAADGQSTDAPTNPEKKDYNQWAAEGLCRIVKGRVIDDDVAARYIREVYDEYGIRPYKVGYDEWHAKEFAKIVDQAFGDNVVTKVRMSYESLNVPTRTLEEYMRARLVNYNNNSICRWNFRNTAIKYDNRGLIMPAKINGYIGNKIDGTMAKIIALCTLRECKSAFMAKIGA
jgi:phage terminase large subunit-like protein